MIGDSVELAQLELSVRTEASLRHSGLYLTAGAIRAASDAELLRMPNFGRRALNEVRGLLGPARREVLSRAAVDTRAGLDELEAQLDRIIGKMERIVSAYRQMKE